ncbi:hypothetical protein J2W42_006718 [Rhizobium tibeticum]|uniref:hypothetical protein n=1 Tax=Rhizobium tibeticum TaxID=501024 RepID=UPI00277EE1DA|nr:hypothetical protein [Rhizobium tibeticum]MDP9813842.1 hypothetical protein [Rhizobium tibeticum]
MPRVAAARGIVPTRRRRRDWGGASDSDYHSPFGVPGAVLTVVIALVTIFFQLTDPLYQRGIIGVQSGMRSRSSTSPPMAGKTLVYSPEEEFAVKQREGAASINRDRV